MPAGLRIAALLLLSGSALSAAMAQSRPGMPAPIPGSGPSPTPAAPAPSAPSPAAPSPASPSPTPSPAPASASPASGTPGSAASYNVGSKSTLNEVVAHQAATIALVDLKLNPAPQRRDFAVALCLLKAASELQPDDQILLRFAIDAAAAADDRATLTALLRRLVKLDPADTTALLAVINQQVQALQSVKERQALYERFLGPAGQSLDPSIRSRLAFDSALLYREVGQNDNFVRRLLQACQLDATNAEAAALYADALIPTLDDPAARYELLANALLADPMEPRTHLRMARFLASCGAHKGALRYFSLAQTLDKANGTDLDSSEQAESLISRWLTSGAAPVYKTVNDFIAFPRKTISDERKRRIENNQDLFGLPDEKELRLPFDLEIVRCALAIAMEDTEAVKGSIEDLDGSIKLREKWINDPKLRPPGIEEGRLRNEVAYWSGPLVFLRMWASPDEPTIAAAVAGLSEDSPVKARCQAMLLAKTDAAAGERALALLAGPRLVPAPARDGASTATAPTVAPGAGEGGDALAAAVLAQMSEKAGNGARAVEIYSNLIRTNPAGLTAAFAAERLKKLNAPEVKLPGAEKLDALAAAAPQSLEDLATRPIRRASMVVDASSLQVGPLDPLAVRIRLRNTAPIPLAIGATRPISDRALLAPSIIIGSESANDYVTSTPIDPARRIRLNPGEELAFYAWADAGFTSWATGNQSSASQRIAFRVLLGFGVDDGATPRIGALGFSADLSGLLRTSLPTDLQQAIDLVPTAKGVALAELIAGQRPRLIQSGTVVDNAVSKFVGAIVARYATATAQERAVILSLMPNKALAPITAPFDTALGKVQETDPLVKKLAIVTRASDSESPLLANAILDTDPTVTALGALQAQRITRQDVMLATTTTVRRRVLDLAPRDRDPNADKNPDKGEKPSLDPGRPPRATRPAGPAPSNGR